MKSRDRPGNMKPRAATLVSLSLLLSIVSGWGCQFETRPPPPPWVSVPKINSFGFHPEYFCSGDVITVTWDTENFDRLALLTNAGAELFSTTSPSGTATTPAIDSSMLPLKVRGYFGDDHEDHVVDILFNIDDPTWTGDLPAVEVPAPGDWRLEPDGDEDFTLPDGSVVQVPVYKIWVIYQGFRWSAGVDGNLPSFSQRAMIDRIRNVTGPTLHFYSLVAGAVRLAAGEEGDIDPNWPASVAWFNGDYYPDPIEHFYGYQHGDASKPPDPWFYVDKIYQEATAEVNLLVICN